MESSPNDGKEEKIGGKESDGVENERGNPHMKKKGFPQGFIFPHTITSFGRLPSAYLFPAVFLFGRAKDSKLKETNARRKSTNFFHMTICPTFGSCFHLCLWETGSEAVANPIWKIGGPAASFDFPHIIIFYQIAGIRKEKSQLVENNVCERKDSRRQRKSFMSTSKENTHGKT